MNHVTLTQQQVGKIGAILAGNARYQRDLPCFYLITHMIVPEFNTKSRLATGLPPG
jgi:beta-N-acetylglucosaminidase